MGILDYVSKAMLLCGNIDNQQLGNYYTKCFQLKRKKSGKIKAWFQQDAQELLEFTY